MADKKIKLNPRRFGLIASLIVCAILLLVIFVPGRIKNAVSGIRYEDKNTVLSITENNVKTIENERFSMTVDKNTLGIELIDKKSGVTYKSYQDYNEGNQTWNGFAKSAVTIEIYSGNSSLSSMIPLSNEKTDISLMCSEEGFVADILFTEYGISLQLQVTLLEDGIHVFIPGDSVKEGEENFLGAVYVYPMFGSTYLGEKEGYMLIPEGAGAIIDLSDNNGKYKNAYQKRIYGENVGTDATEFNSYGTPVVTEAELITYPVFGMIYEEDKAGFLGIVTEGDYNATVYAYPNGVTTPYNFITARFNVRDVYTKQTAKTSGVPIFESKGDIRSMGTRYIFVDGNEASYSGLAKEYREYLIEKGDLWKKNDEFNIKLDFLGADTEKWLVFDSIIEMTTVSDLMEISEDLYESGVTDFNPMYFGWEKDGDSLNKGSLNTSLESKLGTNKELKNLISKLDKNGIELVLNQELLLANSTKVYNTTTDIVKGINQVLVTKPTHQEVFENMYFMTPGRALDVFNSFNKTVNNLEVKGISLSGVSNELYSYYSGGKTYTRADTAAQYLTLFENVDVDKIGLTKPNAYLYKYTDEYYGMPLSTSNYNFISAEVPFLPIVLKGYVPYYGTYTNFEADSTLFYLKMIEYGAYPAFLITKESPVLLKNSNSSYIYTSEYEMVKDKILDYDKNLGNIFRSLNSVSIDEHEYVLEGLARVKYENGVVIYINYKTTDQIFEGVTVPGLSYKILGED